jgi:hypothetical protein
MAGLAFGAALFRPSGAVAAEDAKHEAEKTMYLRYCGACHGPEGKGDGIASSYFRPKPIDLTQLAKQNGGEFPFSRTLHVIDGTATVRAHGDPDMPVWGEILRGESHGPQGPRSGVQGKLMMITDYLRTIQAK